MRWSNREASKIQQRWQATSNKLATIFSIICKWSSKKTPIPQPTFLQFPTISTLVGACNYFRKQKKNFDHDFILFCCVANKFSSLYEASVKRIMWQVIKTNKAASHIRSLFHLCLNVCILAKQEGAVHFKFKQQNETNHLSVASVNTKLWLV